ncbi:hypothetical protein tb265_31270 [Gemmatimonadetes bacterium T265]|nr:hypothetical protein tb265_31270 [Gemmatimonadetes bacterium T265]
MSANLTPVPVGGEPSLPVPAEAAGLAPYDSAAGYGPAPEGEAAPGTAISIGRIASALQRFKWIIVATTALGVLGGVIAGRFVDPQYDVNADIFTTPSQQTGGTGSAARGGNLTQIQGWSDLLKAPAIADPVVIRLALYLRPEHAADSVLFQNFTIDRSKARFYPGDYTLKVDGGRWTLTDQVGAITESGVVGDSIGRRAGFAWVPPARLLHNKATIKFNVVTPREATTDVIRRLSVLANERSPIIYLRLSGTAAQRPAATLNAMLDQFVTVATDLKKRELNQQSTTLATQLEAARQKLEEAERRLEQFRVGAITKPSEGVTVAPPAAAGVDAGVGTVTSDPVITNYGIRKLDYDQIRRDREQLERIAQSIRSGGPLPVDAINSVTTVARDPGATPLRTAIADYNDQQSKLEKWRVTFTDSEPTTQQLRIQLNAARQNVLRQNLAFIGTLKERETNIRGQLGDATRELEAIPQRTTEQTALQREVSVQGEIYSRLRGDYASASLAQQASVPDVKVLDSAVTPLQPSNNTTVRIIGVATAAGLALGVALAILLDLLDRRFRYPDQVTKELGLSVLGVVPRIDEGRGRQSAERAAQIVEAFRALRLNVRYAAPPNQPVALGITSPGAGDGKSLVASNLALAFAQGGWRTVLVDADVRRGQLHGTFDLPASPGLVEYLEGTSLLSEVLHPTHHENLWVVPAGQRHRRAPELLATARLPQLLAALGAEHDAIIVDTPPLGAGTDAYSVGAACGQLAVVLRRGVTDVRLAKAKLKILEHLPIAIPGAILNGVATDASMYEYYSYDPDYAAVDDGPRQPLLSDESESTRLPARLVATRE